MTTLQQVLGTLDDRRTTGLFGDVRDALHAQRVRPILLQGIEEEAQRLARDRLLAHKAE